MRHGQIRQLDRLVTRKRIRILQGIKVLHQPDHRVTSFRESVLFYLISILLSTSGYGRKLTTKTDPWATIEWQILPTMTTVLLPAFRAEDMGIRTIEVGASVHGPDTVCHRIAFLDVDGGLLVRTASKRQTCVRVCDAEVEWHGGL